MLTKLSIKNFKLFDDVELELGDRVVLIGPNNAGKTSALQALALWDIGLKRWLEKRGSGDTPTQRSGVTINRCDLIAVPVPTSKLLWRDLHVRSGRRENGKTRTQNVLVDIVVEGPDWCCGLEFDYANEESFYCRPSRQLNGHRMAVPASAGSAHMAYLPPMSGLAANEIRLEPGAINVRLGEGRTAEVLRNLCYSILESEDGLAKWKQVTNHIASLFGSQLELPRYIAERGEITMAYRTRDGVRLDLAASGRGQQQTLLLLAHMTANPGSVLLLDEPDAHLEILRQRQMYRLLSDTAEKTGSQIIAASHSEVVLNEAAGKDVLIAFVGKPHRIDKRGSQIAKALKDIGFEHYLQAEEKGWVLYLEGATDLAILLALAQRLGHAAKDILESPYVHYVANQPPKAREHFYGLREAKPNLVGIAIYDHLDQSLPIDPNLMQCMWQQREMENYLCHRNVLLNYASEQGKKRSEGPLFAAIWRQTMEVCIDELEQALGRLGKPDPWGPDSKATDDFLDPLFKNFYEKLKRPGLMRKSNYHRLASFLNAKDIGAEIVEKLDAIVTTAERVQTQ